MSVRTNKYRNISVVKKENEILNQTYYMITNNEETYETNHGIFKKYHTGLNIFPCGIANKNNKFGFYFSHACHLPKYTFKGAYIRQVTFSENYYSKVYQFETCFKSDAVVLGPSHSLFDIKTYTTFKLNPKHFNILDNIFYYDKFNELVTWCQYWKDSLKEFDEIIYTDFAIDSALKNNNYPIVSYWINFCKLNQIYLQISSFAIDFLSKNNQCEIIEMIFDLYKKSSYLLSFSYTENALDFAIKNGYTAIIFLWINFCKDTGLPVKYSESALDDASASASIAVVKLWLYLCSTNNLQPKYSADALDGASVANCALLVNFWFDWCKTRDLPIKYSETAVDSALKLSKPKIVKLWFSLCASHSLKVKYTENAIDYLQQNNDTEMLGLWFDLCEKYGDDILEKVSPQTSLQLDNPDLTQTFYKITNESETHHSYTYTNGLNICPDIFTNKSIGSGGFYFTTKDYLHEFIEYGCNIRTLTLPSNNLNFKIAFFDKFLKANMIFIGEKYSLYDIQTYKSLNLDISKYYVVDYMSKYNKVALLEQWVNTMVHQTFDIKTETFTLTTDQLIYSENALNWASENGHTVIIEKWFELSKKYNLELKYTNYALDTASENNHRSVVHLWINYCITNNIEPSYSSDALNFASAKNHCFMVELWFSFYRNHNLTLKYTEDAINFALINGHFGMVSTWIKLCKVNNLEIKFSGTELVYATDSGRLDLVQELLDTKAV